MYMYVLYLNKCINLILLSYYVYFMLFFKG